jgi:hypothetical protein
MSSAVDSSTTGNLRRRQVLNIVSEIANGFKGVPGQVAEVGGEVAEVLPVTQPQNDVAGRLAHLQCLAGFYQ